jgi:membrane protease YdiL (CAAX protease family)
VNRNIQKATIFLCLTFLANYLMVTLYLYFGGKWVMPWSLTIGVAYMFVPMLMAIVVQKLIYKEPLKEPLGISFKLNWWFLVAWMLPPVIAFATLGVSLLLPGVEFSPQMAGLMERFKSVFTPEQLQQMEQQMTVFPIHPFWISLLQGLVAGVTVNAVAGFGEELGWRGLLQREFGFMGFWKSSALIGFVWGIWHAPLILQGHNYPEHPEAGVFMMTIFTILLSPIFSYVRLKAKSVIAAAIIHGSLNATVGLALMVVAGGNDLTIGVTGLAGFIVLALVNLVLFLYDRLWAKEPVAVA